MPLNNQEKLKLTYAWIEKALSENNHCDVSITLSTYGGNISKIQKSVTEKFVETAK